MAQNAIPITSFKSGTAQAQPSLSFGNTPSYDGGVSVSLGVTAATVIKASAGVLHRLTFPTAGTNGTFTINDCASTAAATNAGPLYNQIISITPTAATAAGAQVIALHWPFKNGLTVSVVTGGGALNLSFD